MRAQNNRLPKIGAARADGRHGAQNGADHLDHRSVFDGGAGAAEVAAFNVAGFMGHHTDHRVGALALQQKPGVNVHVAAPGNKSIEGAVLDQANTDAFGIQPGGFEQWRCVGADDTFDFGVADDGLALRKGVGAGHDPGQNDDQGKQRPLPQSHMSHMSHRASQR